ncbi:MAG TPA: rRNA maturation RNase YbeY [Caldithrix abyssi]|uniref:Endoribonuclease YbeY n=1 Tax=Caldithrix abyssi TaxID=187145 RepID=A0A7V1LKW6_CALAY|nr:rRNA maturation RNase YbeY [Caldithrix abyssi]
MEIALHNTHPDINLEEETVTELVRKVSRDLSLKMASCTVICTDDTLISDLHNTYFNDPDTTDVITFDLGEDAVEGEIYVCVDQAARQAKEFGVSTPNEIRRLIIHGLLHLAGYDDREEADRREMKELENRLYGQTPSW